MTVFKQHAVEALSVIRQTDFVSFCYSYSFFFFFQESVLIIPLFKSSLSDYQFLHVRVHIICPSYSKIDFKISYITNNYHDKAVIIFLKIIDNYFELNVQN